MFGSMLSAGVDDNEIIKVPRSGGADPDGNQPGDLFVTVRVRFITNFFHISCLLYLSYVRLMSKLSFYPNQHTTLDSVAR